MTGGNWGIIGPGNIAKEFIADLPYAAKNQTVTAVLGRKMESVNAFADEHYIRGRYTSINEFVEKGKPGLVYIATPHPASLR
ncbi:MAG: Gfo/Idh/MocA family oxidoreductase [Bacteroidota bacterium]